MIFDYFNLTTITKLNELLVSMDKKLDKILEKFSSGLDATTTCRSSSKTINKDDPKFVVSTKLERKNNSNMFILHRKMEYFC